MLFTVQQLIEDRPAPTTIGPEQTGLEALNLMIQHDFSQLPVVDEASELVGLITSDSLLRAVNNLGVLSGALRVKDALLKPRTAAVESDVFDLIDDLKRCAAVLIVDATQQLVGIVTDYDAMEFLRRRAEDMMLVEDIETSLKDHICAAFTTNGHIDDQALSTAIADVTSPRKDPADQFRRALAYYLGLTTDGPAAKPDAVRVTEVIDRFYKDKAQSKSLDDLTMAEYANLMLHKSRQTYIDHVFPVGAQAIRGLFDSVRQTRNALAHFHGGITPQQHEQLQFCAQLLTRARASFTSTAENMASSIGSVPASTEGTAMAAQGGVVREQPIGAGTTSTSPDAPVTGPRVTEGEPVRIAATGAMRVADYAKLTAALRAQPPDRKVVSMAFSEIERLIGGSLPDAARLHRSWWSNDASTYAYAKAWVDAGWRVGADMVEEVATFTRDRT